MRMLHGRNFCVNYKNAQDILPDRLLQELQEYAAGLTLYIPHVREKKSWGESSGARAYYKQRNEEIRRRRKEGVSVTELAEEYHLSTDSVRKILAV